MSRFVVFSAMMSLTIFWQAGAGRLTEGQIAAILDHGKQANSVQNVPCSDDVSDADADPDKEIVVCAVREDGSKYRVPREGPSDENIIRRGEAVSTVRAACCPPIPILPPTIGIGFGYVPPITPDYREVMKGLPEPDTIVPEGTSAAEARAAKTAAPPR